jgi:MoaA/NifB/PqqE/SkfB family radical SAM enzyme
MKLVYKLIRLNRLIRSYRLKFLSVLIADLIGMRHLFLRLDPVNACNLRCQMCYYSDREYAKKIRGRFSAEELDRIQNLFFDKAVQLVVGCGSEPTLHKDYVNIIRQGRESGIPFVGLTTNGQLITKHDLEQLVSVGLNEITISTHGVHRHTYEKFMAGASYQKLLTLLEMLDEIKSHYNTPYPTLRLNYTTNPENLDELEDFFSVYGQFNIDTIQLRPMVDVGNTSYAYESMGKEILTNYYFRIQQIREECKKRHITCLSTSADPNFKNFDKGTSYILPAVLRTIHPNKVWMIDFDWRNENYRNYCRRTKWRRVLLGTVIGDREYFKKTNHFLTYDVDI